MTGLSQQQCLPLTAMHMTDTFCNNDNMPTSADVCILGANMCTSRLHIPVRVCVCVCVCARVCVRVCVFVCARACLQWGMTNMQ